MLLDIPPVTMSNRLEYSCAIDHDSLDDVMSVMDIRDRHMLSSRSSESLWHSEECRCAI